MQKFIIITIIVLVCLLQLAESNGRKSVAKKIVRKVTKKKEIGSSKDSTNPVNPYPAYYQLYQYVEHPFSTTNQTIGKVLTLGSPDVEQSFKIEQHLKSSYLFHYQDVYRENDIKKYIPNRKRKFEEILPAGPTDYDGSKLSDEKSIIYMQQYGGNIYSAVTQTQILVIKCSNKFETNITPIIFQYVKQIYGYTKQLAVIIVKCRHFCNNPIVIRQESEQIYSTFKQEANVFYNCPEKTNPKFIVHKAIRSNYGHPTQTAKAYKYEK